MKFTKVSVDRNQFAKRLGVEPSQLAVAEVDYNLDDVTITLVLDNDVELKSDIDAVTIYDGGRNLRRFKLVEDTEALKKQLHEYQTQNLKLHQEIAELQQKLIDTHLQTFDNKRGKLANLHTGEKVLNRSEVEKVIKSTSILEDIMKEVSPLFNNFHETDKNKDVDAVSEALDKAEKVFNVVFNVSEYNTKTPKELVEEIGNAMKNMGKWQ